MGGDRCNRVSRTKASLKQGYKVRLYSPTSCKRAAWKWHLSALLWEVTDVIGCLGQRHPLNRGTRFDCTVQLPVREQLGSGI